VLLMIAHIASSTKKGLTVNSLHAISFSLLTFLWEISMAVMVDSPAEKTVMIQCVLRSVEWHY
jgi:hypothetical protein